MKYFILTLLHKSLKYFLAQFTFILVVQAGGPNLQLLSHNSFASAEVKAATSACFPHWAATAVCSCIRHLRSCAFIATVRLSRVCKSFSRLRIFLTSVNLSHVCESFSRLRIFLVSFGTHYFFLGSHWSQLLLNSVLQY